MIERIKWHIKQLLPLTYATTYTEGEQRKVCYWRMWFGRCYDIKEFNVCD